MKVALVTLVVLIGVLYLLSFENFKGGNLCSRLDQRDCYRVPGCNWCVDLDYNGSCRKSNELEDCMGVSSLYGPPIGGRRLIMTPPAYYSYPSPYWNNWGWGWNWSPSRNFRKKLQRLSNGGW